MESNLTFAKLVLAEIRRRGVKASVNKWMVCNEFRYGVLKGKDQFGNEYFENKTLPHGRHRWVEAGDYSKWERFDSTKVPAEWHGWLHHMADETPVEKMPEIHKWRVAHEGNLTGSKSAYMGPDYLLQKHDRKFGGVKPVHTEDGGIAFQPRAQAWDPNREVAEEAKTSVNKEFKSFVSAQKSK